MPRRDVLEALLRQEMTAVTAAGLDYVASDQTRTGLAGATERMNLAVDTILAAVFPAAPPLPPAPPVRDTVTARAIAADHRAELAAAARPIGRQP